MTAPHPARFEFRAGGTDLSERRRSGVSRGPVVDIGRRPELSGIAANAAGGLDLGALTPIADVAADPSVRAGYPGWRCRRARSPRRRSAAYHRAITCAHAEWPLVEAVARLVVVDGEIAVAGVAVGGVAPVPLRLAAVEAELIGRPPTARVLAAAAERAADGARPLSTTRYKVPLLVGTVAEVLERAAG